MNGRRIRGRLCQCRLRLPEWRFLLPHRWQRPLSRQNPRRSSQGWRGQSCAMHQRRGLGSFQSSRLHLEQIWRRDRLADTPWAWLLSATWQSGSLRLAAWLSECSRWVACRPGSSAWADWHSAWLLSEGWLSAASHWEVWQWASAHSADWPSEFILRVAL